MLRLVHRSGVPVRNVRPPGAGRQPARARRRACADGLHVPRDGHPARCPHARRHQEILRGVRVRAVAGDAGRAGGRSLSGVRSPVACPGRDRDRSHGDVAHHAGAGHPAGPRALCALRDLHLASCGHAQGRDRVPADGLADRRSYRGPPRPPAASRWTNGRSSPGGNSVASRSGAWPRGSSISARTAGTSIRRLRYGSTRTPPAGRWSRRCSRGTLGRP